MGVIIPSAFRKVFSIEQYFQAWKKIGAMLVNRNCLSNKKMRHSIGDGDNKQQASVFLIQEHNIIACNALGLAGYNSYVVKIAIKPIGCTQDHHTPQLGMDLIVESDQSL